MVRIPDRPYGYIARQLPDVSAAAAAASSGMRRTAATFAAIEQGLDTAIGIANRMQKERDTDLLVEAQNRYTQSMTDFSIKAEQERTGGNARGYTKDFLGASDTAMADVATWLEQNGGSSGAGQAFSQWATQRKTAGNATAARFEHGQLLTHSNDLFNQRLQTISDQVESSPGSYADAVTQLEESFALGVEQGLFREEEAKTKFHEAKERLGVNAFESLYATDRGRAMKAVDAFGLSPVQAAKAKKRYQADVRADAAIARAERAEKAGLLLDDLEDAETIATYTGDAAAMETIGKSLAALGDKRGEKIIRKAEFYRESKALITESTNIPLSELATSINAERGKMTVASGTSDPGSLRRSALTLQVQEKIYAERVAALKADPAGSVTMRATKIAGEAATPAALVDARLRLQSGDGLAAPLQKVLTSSERENFANAWRAGGTQERLVLFQQIQASYGKHAPRVIGEIGLNPLVESMARTALTTGKAEAFTAAATAADAADKDLPALPENTVKLLVREVTDGSKRLSAMRDMMTRVMPGNSAVAGAVRASEDAAGRMLRMNGGNADAAIAMLDSGIGSITSGQYSLMFEKDAIDEDSLEDGLAYALKNELQKFDESLPGYSAAQKKEERIKQLQRKGIWGNAPDGEGFVLYDPQGQAPIVDKNGRYFRVMPKDAKRFAVRGDK